MDDSWDCIVVGGGAAGLSAALVLGRARQRTLVVDAGRPSNLVADGIGGLLGHDRRPPAVLYAIGRGDVAAYPDVVVGDGEVVAGGRDDERFVLELADGSAAASTRVLLATGMDYRFRDVPGAAERWGHSVFHCPFCHGWEHRAHPLGVLDSDPTGVHRALLLRTWSDDVTLFTDGPADLDGADLDRLRTAGVEVDERSVAALQGPGTELTAVSFADGSERPCGGLLVAVTLHQRSPLPAQLGAELAPQALSHEAIVVDTLLRTSVAGLYAAGDVTAQMPSVANAIAAGSTVAATIVRDTAGV